MVEIKQYITALEQAADSLFKSHFGMDVDIMHLEKDKTEIESQAISVLLGIVGDVKGQIICSFDEATAKNIVGMMMGGMEITEIDEMAWSAIQEFGNWVAGTSAVEMSKVGTAIDTTPPVLNKGMSVFRSPDKFAILKLQSIIGNVHVYVSLKGA